MSNKYIATKHLAYPQSEIVGLRVCTQWLLQVCGFAFTEAKRFQLRWEKEREKIWQSVTEAGKKYSYIINSRGVRQDAMVFSTWVDSDRVFWHKAIILCQKNAWSQMCLCVLFICSVMYNLPNKLPETLSTGTRQQHNILSTVNDPATNGNGEK